MKVAAFGRTQWLYNSIQALADQGHQIVLIGTCSAAPEYSVGEEDFEALAEQFNANFFCDAAINQGRYLEMMRESGAEVAISVNWLTLIGQSVLDQFPHGVINAHMGPLPRFRGNATPGWAILLGEDEVVVTLHHMVVELDAGPILLQRSVPLGDEVYIGDVYRFVDENIPSMFVEVVDGLEQGTIVPREQPDDPALSLRCFPRLPRDSELDWSESAESLARLVRASAEPFSGAYTYEGTKKIVVWRAYASQLDFPYVGAPGQVVWRNRTSGEVAVLARSGILVLQEVEDDTGTRSPAASLVKSMRTRFGMDYSLLIAQLEKRIAELEKKE